jgi:hypothetical protein
MDEVELGIIADLCRGGGPGLDPDDVHNGGDYARVYPGGECQMNEELIPRGVDTD